MKNKKTAGLTLTEMLCCVVIMLLVSIGMVNGVSLAVRNYQSSLMASESQLLCSTISSLVTDELRYAGAVDWNARPIQFGSPSYGRCYFGQNDEKQVTLNTVSEAGTDTGKSYKLLPSRAYHFGMGAKVTIEPKEEPKENTPNTFSVTIIVSAPNNGPELAKSEFDVEQLNPT